MIWEESCVTFSLALLAGTATLALAAPVLTESHAATVRIAGFGGSDPAVITNLLDYVLADDIAAAGITVGYTPVDAISASSS